MQFENMSAAAKFLTGVTMILPILLPFGAAWLGTHFNGKKEKE